MAGKRTIGTILKKTKSGAELDDLRVAHLTSIGEIGLESEEIETTDHDSEDDFKEFIAGTKDAGEISLAGNLFLESDFEKLLALANSRSLEDWTVTYPSGAVWAFKAFVKSLKDGEKGTSGVGTFSATLRVSGKPTFTPTPVTP